MDPVARLQARLGPALEANRPGSGVSHVVIILPSYSVSESILSHYGDRIASLEHRYLNAVLMAARIPDCEAIFVSTKRPDDVAIEAVLDLVPPSLRSEVVSRFYLHEVDDGSIEAAPSLDAITLGAFAFGFGRNTAAPAGIEREFLDRKRPDIAQQIKCLRGARCRPAGAVTRHLIVGKCGRECHRGSETTATRGLRRGCIGHGPRHAA